MDYLYIRAWCRLMGSYAYYTEDEIARARADKAPQTAIYHKGGGSPNDPREWAVFEEIQNPEAKERVARYVKELEDGKPQPSF